MKNSIILPTKFENIFMIEARKSNLIKHIDIGEDLSRYDGWEEKLYSKYHKARQNVFQMILLYDELIIPAADPTYEYDKLQDKDNFLIYSFDDYCQYDPIHEDGHIEFAEYLKPVIIPVITKELKKYFLIKDKSISYKSIASEIYDITLGLKKEINNNVDFIIEVNKFLYDLQHKDYFKKMNKLNAPSVINEDIFYTKLSQTILRSYTNICWQLDISSRQDAYIINCEYQLSKIGCGEYQKDVSAYLDSYKLLKCECSKIIGSLPKMNNLNDVFELKDKRKNDIKNLKEVLTHLEYVLKNEGKEQAVIKATNDVKKASESLAKRNELTTVGKWTTLFSVPVAIMEILCGIPPIGLVLSTVGTGVCIADDILKKRNGWCEIVR